MNLESVLSMLGLLGIGGVIGTYFRIQWERRNTALLQKQEFKETRYKCLIMLMWACLDFDKRGAGLEQYGRNFKSVDDIIDELRAEWHNAILFASDEVLQAMHDFIKQPTIDHFKRSALAMRKDLWGGKLSAELQKLSV